MIDETQLKNIVKEILTHESVSRDTGISKEVQSSYNALASSGEQAVPHIVSALNECARGLIGGMWWYGAEELCKLLSQIKTSSAKEALLTILKTDSNIVEFDRVRSLAVDLILCFNDPTVIPVLLEASKVPHAPILAINKAIEALGGTKPATPETIILDGKKITDDGAALQYFAKHAVQVSSWSSKELQGAFFWWYGNRVEKLKGLHTALPYYAAAVLADHDSEAPAWSKFSRISPSAQTARQLAQQYPLSYFRPFPQQHQKLDINQHRFNEHQRAGCFIATAIYGDQYHPSVCILREYRDDILLKAFLGRLFIELYYAISPHMIVFIKGNQWIEKGIKKLLDKFINRISNKY